MEILKDGRLITVWMISSILTLVFAAVIMLLVMGYQSVSENRSYGNWKTLVNNELNYKIEYPAGWSAEIFPIGFKDLHRGLPEGIRAFFVHEFIMGFNKKAVALYWIPMKEPDLIEALRWGNETIEQDRKGVGIQKIRVGVGQYPAVTRMYPVDIGTRKTVYIVANGGVFVLEFLVNNYNAKYEAIFDHMLASFEILDE